MVSCQYLHYVCTRQSVCVCVCVCFINNTLFVHLVHLFTLVSVSWSDFPWSRRWTAQASKFCCLAFVAWFWCFVLHFFFVFWQAYGLYRIQTSKKKKKGKDIGEANIHHSWFSMVWHPKAEPQENTSAPPDLHQTVTTITGLPKKKKW